MITQIPVLAMLYHSHTLARLVVFGIPAATVAFVLWDSLRPVLQIQESIVKPETVLKIGN
jgi:uncharacterized membrane protein YesL